MNSLSFIILTLFLFGDKSHPQITILKCSVQLNNKYCSTKHLFQNQQNTTRPVATIEQINVFSTKNIDNKSCGTY